MEDSQIIVLFQERSEEAVRAVSDKYSGYCRSIAGNILPSAEDVEECLNDTWLAAWNAIPPQKPKLLNIYLGRITRNLALNRIKLLSAEKRGGGQAALALEELSDCIGTRSGPEEQLDEQHLREAIDAFVRSQPERKRRIFIRRYWALEPVQVIAREFGMSRGQVSTMLYRMRSELKQHLEKEGINV